jgi:4-amino-4-deoxy-L-arabinose transferase-like glycosyltransferase
MKNIAAIYQFGYRYFSKVDAGIIVLLALPWLNLIFNQTWIYSPMSLDPWFYWGYFNNFGSFSSAFAGTYYGTRLSWIIPGYACYKLFPPVVANLVLHIGFFYTAIFSLYFTLKRLFNNRAALFVSILMSFYTYFLASIGTDYIDGAGITYVLLTILILTYATTDPRPGKWSFQIQRDQQSVMSTRVMPLSSAFLIFLAGMTMGLCIYSNTFLLLYVLIVCLYFLILNHRYAKHSLFFSFIFAALGFAAITILLGLANKLAGGQFSFFITAFNAAWYYLGQPNPWRASSYEWLKYAFWLVFPVLGAVISLVYLVLRIKKKDQQVPPRLPQQPMQAHPPLTFPQRSGSLLSICYLVLFLLFLLLEIKGTPSLQLHYYASFLIPFLFLAVGSQLAGLLNKLEKWHFYAIIGGLIILLLLCYCQTFRLLFSFSSTAILTSSLVVIGVASLALFKLRSSIFKTLSVVLLVIFLAAANFTMINTSSWVDYSKKDPPEQLLMVVSQSNQLIKRFDPEVQMKFWYSSKEPLAGVFDSIAATRLWGYRLLNLDYPNLSTTNPTSTTPQQTVVPAGTKIMILTQEEGAFEKVTASFKQEGQNITLLHEETIAYGTLKLNLTIIQVQNPPASGL